MLLTTVLSDQWAPAPEDRTKRRRWWRSWVRTVEDQAVAQALRCLGIVSTRMSPATFLARLGRGDQRGADLDQVGQLGGGWRRALSRPGVVEGSTGDAERRR